MKKRIKRVLIDVLIILIILTIAYIIIRRPFASVETKTAICLGKNAILYTQYGCHACETQKEIFGENYKYLTIVDCWYESEKCPDILATPTWKFGENTKGYAGVQSIEKLKELSGC